MICVCLFYRVCKKWYSILRDKSSWQYIDFTEKGPIINKLVRVGQREMCYRTQWRFPDDEAIVLTFLEKYAGGCLKEIRLQSMTTTIVHYLHEKCPNLLSICGHLNINENDVINFPMKVIKFELESTTTAPLSDSDSTDSDDYVSRLQRRDKKVLNELFKLSNLKFMKLGRFWLSNSATKASLGSACPLRELHIINPNVFGQGYGYKEYLDDVISEYLGCFERLQCLRLDCTGSVRQFKSQLINLPSSIGCLKNLNVLTLKGVQCSEDLFAIMMPALLNLEVLELEGEILSSGAIQLIGRNARKIRHLELGNGNYTDCCLRYLESHPTIENLWIYKDYFHRHHINQHWILAIFRVVLSSLRTQRVKIEGYMLTRNIEGIMIPDVPESVTVAINDMPEELMSD